MPKRDPDIILARFQRNPSVRDKYVGVGIENETRERIFLGSIRGLFRLGAE